MTSKIFALEQRIMNCWNVVDDLDDLYYYFGDDPFFKDMDAKHRDKICNLLLGMKEMYQIKFQKCIFDFEDVCKEYHSHNKRHDHEFIDSIALIIAEQLCNRFSDKDGGEVLDKDFEVLRERIGGLLCS